jgi:hypothetical protein
MSNISGSRRGLKSKNDPRLPYSQRGWEDARAGKPFDYNLVDAAETKARAYAYELSRHRVILLKAMNLPVPAGNAYGVLPPRVAAAIKRATRINVDCKRQGEPVFYDTPIDP